MQSVPTRNRSVSFIYGSSLRPNEPSCEKSGAAAVVLPRLNTVLPANACSSPEKSVSRTSEFPNQLSAALFRQRGYTLTEFICRHCTTHRLPLISVRRYNSLCQSPGD